MKEYVAQRGKTFTYWIDTGTDENGRRRRETKGGFKTESEAHAAARRRLVEIEKNSADYRKPSKETVGDFLERWLRDYARNGVAPRTYEGYEHIIRRHLIPSLGSIQLLKLTPTRLQEYYANKLGAGRLNGKGGLSPRTVRHHHVTLHDALASAVKWGLLSRNPADAVDAPRFQRPEMHTLDDDGLRDFLSAARKTRWYAPFYVSLFTGLRRSELLALRWDDVDLDLGQIMVTRALHRLRDGSTVIRAPKSAKGRRMVALPPSAALVLRQHREDETSRRLLLEVPPLAGSDLVFSRVDGSPIPPDSLTHAWMKLARRTGFRGLRLHDARHTHASILLKQGIHPKVVQERLGHATIATTLDVYSHVAPGLQEAAAQRFDMLVGEAVNESVNMSPSGHAEGP